MEMEDKLINAIGQTRYKHSLNVVDISVKLANKYGCNIEKTKIAALLHDCAKYSDLDYLLKRSNDFGIILDDIMAKNKELMHGPLGAAIAAKEFDIEDKEILEAIKYHTTGRENMTLLDKIIYIADYIEPGRSFPGVEKVRELAFTNLDEALIMALENTIKYLISINKLIHLDTIKARNDLLLKLNAKREVYIINE